MVFDDKAILNESLNFDFGKNIHSENKIRDNETKNGRLLINTNPKCEPQLGKRNLYHAIGAQTPSQAGQKISNQLVKKKLVACVNITKIDSVYSWKGKIQNDSEYLAFFKTTKKNEKTLKNEIKKLHPYDVPEIAEINVNSMNKPYLDWLNDSTI